MKRTLKNNILFYSSRVDPGNISFVEKMTNTMIDLSFCSFEASVVKFFSPVAFSVVNHDHWYHPTAKHSGVETTVRYVMNIAHILRARYMVKTFHKQCTRCVYLLKWTVWRFQWLLYQNMLLLFTIQCGSFMAYSKNIRRTTLKVWIVTFVCATTGSIRTSDILIFRRRDSVLSAVYQYGIIQSIYR